MAKARNTESVASLVSGVSDMLNLCRDVAMALIETGQPWTTQSSIRSFWWNTDHDMTRKQVQQRFKSVITEVERIRREEISPDAIRGVYLLSNMRNCCERCAELNKKNLRAGRAFVCFAQQLAQHGTDAASRFCLNEEGQIVERHPK